MNMKNYREKLKMDTVIIAIVALILASFTFLGFAAEAGTVDFFTPVTGDSHWRSSWNGFISGASAGLLIFMIIAIIRNIRAIRNENALKKLYVKDNDERTEQVVRYAQSAAYRTLLMVGLVAVVVAGYFNVTVSLTILACLWVSALLAPLYKLYFAKKF